MTLYKAIASLLLLFFFLSTNVTLGQQPVAQKRHAAGMCPAADLAAIQKQWSEWTAAYTSHDLAKTMEIFDHEVIFSFQGSPDQNFAALERGYKDEFAQPNNGRVWVPQFEEFECSGNLGFVRSTWVLRQTGPSGQEQDVEKNRGIDLFRLQPHSGKWKIFRSLNYPLQPSSK